mgnify:FL=1
MPAGKLIFSLVFIFITMGLRSQSIETAFGKNRVQFHDDFRKWDKYETENFIVHWYGKARNVARLVIPIAEYYHQDVQSIMEHRMNDKIQIFVYLDITDNKQSNIGNDDIWTSRAEETTIIGNKMFVYFDGNHQNLKLQIRRGVAGVYLHSMLFGSNFQEMMQSSVQSEVPDWYKEGIIAYAGSPWDHFIEDELRDILERNDKYLDFNKLSEDHPRVAGHSLWHYISEFYSPSAIPNLLYLTKISRDMKESFIYVLSESQATVFEGWSRYYRDYFGSERNRYVSLPEESQLKLKNRKYDPISIIRLSPNGKFLAYAENEIGRYRVWVKDLESGTEKMLFRMGHKNAVQETDYNYPLITWHPDNRTITMAYERRDIIYLRKIDIATNEFEEQSMPEMIQRLYSLSYLDDIHYVVSASINGFSNIGKYNARFRTYDAITDDFYNDLDAVVAEFNGTKGVLFSSNRNRNDIQPENLDTVLPLEKFDIFFYELQDKNKSLQRLTQNSEENARMPFVAGKDKKIIYIGDRSGMLNTYVIDPFSERTYPITNLNRNLILHHAVPDSDLLVMMKYINGAYRVFAMEKEWEKMVRTSPTPFRRSIHQDEILIPLLEELTEDEEIKEEYKFVTIFDDPDYLPELKDEKSTNTFVRNLFPSTNILALEDREVIRFNSARVTASRLTFRIDDISTRVDNQVLFEGLESFIGNPDQLNINPLGILLKGTVKDLLEDYVIEAGVRIPTTFDGSEYYLIFDDRKKLIDRRYALYRRVHTDFSNDRIFPSQRSKKNTLLGMYQAKYPFDIYRSIRATATLRFDRLFFQSSENVSFQEPVVNEKRLGLRVEYIFDNTINIEENIRHGTRYKGYAEVINRFNFELVDGINIKPNEGFTTILGFDARHYIPVLNHSIIALRGAGATSFGSEKMMYFLGGVNGWVIQRFDENIPTPEDDSFAYKTAAVQMRGFNFNIRNGATYALINTEFRFPMFKYFYGRNLRSNFLRNFQIVGFFDAGTAWHGWSPFSPDNPINTQTIESPPTITVKIDYFRDPLVMGYGFGLRSKLFGYSLKLDYAWGIETRRIQKPIFYLALGTDF